jgi:hypothetical protein
MTVGVVETVKDSQSGRSLWVTVSGQRFLCKENGIRNFIGKEIIFEPSSSEHQGKTYHWINNFQPSDTSEFSPPVNRGTPETRPKPAIEPMALLPITSNLTAHAIQAGLIKTPGEIHAWAAAAFAAAKAIMKPGDDFDDEIPF